MSLFAPFTRFFSRPAQAFRIRHYPAFWGGNVLQFFAFQANLAANQWLITDITPSRTLLSMVGFVQGGMIAVTSPFSGVVVDRLPKRNLLISGRLLFSFAVAATATLVWLDLIHIWQLLAIGMLIGITQSIMQPATQTFVFDIAGRDRVQNAIALNSLGTGISQILGPGLAGLVIGAAGVLAVFVSASAGLACACLLLLFIPLRGRPAAASGDSVLTQLKEGLSYVRSNRPLFWVFVCCALSLFNGALIAMRPVFARHVLDVSAGKFGLMASCQGLGAICGSIFVSTLPPARRPGLLTCVAMMGYGSCLFLYSFAFSYGYVLVVEFMIGVASQFWQVSVFSGMQMCVPEAMRGRMVSLVFMCAQLGFIGQLFAGILADRTNDQFALGLFGAIPTVSLALIFVFKFHTLAALRPLQFLDEEERPNEGAAL